MDRLFSFRDDVSDTASEMEKKLTYYSVLFMKEIFVIFIIIVS